MKLLLTSFLLCMCFGLFAQQPDTRYFELRIYYCYPGRLDALVERFQNHTTRIFEKHGMESEAVVRQVNESGADILFVGFGMPLQEYWIAENASKLKVHAILPCGSMIDYAAGTRHLTPRWMADHGLEWLYRLIQEPSRLWTRYLIGNPLFVLRVLQQRLAKREA